MKKSINFEFNTGFVQLLQINMINASLKKNYHRIITF